MPIYMKYDGIDGGVTAQGHDKWIELHSAQLGVNRHITSASGRGTNREASAPAVSEIVVTKDQDVASTSLFKASLWGEGKKVKIDFCKTDKDKLESYLTVELENTLVSSFSCSGSGGDTHSRPMESLSLNFTKITYNSTLMDKTNATAKPDRAMWDLATSKGA
jgi:type VI secretion system secreted protein Hcp